MRAYEVVYVLDASLEQEAVDAKLNALHSVLGGEVAALDHWGVRQLAYPIAKARTAYYAVAQLSAEPTALPEFERQLKLDEEIVRHLIVLNEGQSTSGASLLAARPNSAPDADAEGDADDLEVARDAPEFAVDAGADEEEEETDSDAQEASEAPEAADEGEATDDAPSASPSPRSGPPEFAGTRGRRRRHEGPPIVLLNYKDVATLSRFLTDQGKILPKRTTKVTAAFQRQLGTAVKRARFLALLPYTKDHLA